MKLRTKRIVSALIVVGVVVIVGIAKRTERFSHLFDFPAGDTASSTSLVQTGRQARITDTVDLNTAGKEELMTLYGIGAVKADTIIEYRNANGPFRNIEDIMNVKGVGPKTFEKIKNVISAE